MTKTTAIPFSETGFFSKTICDYLDQKDEIREFYGHFSDLKGFEKQIESRLSFNDQLNRSTLVKRLKNQYYPFEVSEKTQENIDLLGAENTFTITTGHQLNLFTGPLYFLYKIISTINLTEQLKKEFPSYHFVPIYWMATEDHDFEEIQYFNFQGKKFSWQRDSSGAVGRLTTEGLDEVFEEFSKELGSGKNAREIKGLFKKSYLNHPDLASATLYLANELFGKYGLVILDADNQDLKKRLIPHIKKELLEQTCYQEVNKTIEKFGKHYKVQVNPREINLFYLDDQLRERIVFENGLFKINNTDLVFTKQEILNEVDLNPEKFSPNVLMRPLYQEVILPNLCYIGGGGELAYWLELKGYFEKMQVSFPILLLRNSVLLLSSKQRSKMLKLDLSDADIFRNQQELINAKVKQVSKISIDFSAQRKELKAMFEDLEVLSNQTERSFIGAVKAQEKRQLNGLDKLEKRLLRAQKRKLSDLVSRLTVLQNELFPKTSLQERNANFSEFYLSHGHEINALLMDHLDPLGLEFDLIEI